MFALWKNKEAFFDHTASEHVTIGLYDIQGRHVKSILEQSLPAGDHNLRIDAAGLPSGIYFARASGNGFAQTRKLVLMR